MVYFYKALCMLSMHEMSDKCVITLYILLACMRESGKLGLSRSPTELESEEITIVVAPNGLGLSISGTTANSEDDCDDITSTISDGGRTIGSPRCRLGGAGAIHSSR